MPCMKFTKSATASEFDYVNTVFIRSVKVRLDLRFVSSCSLVPFGNSQIISDSHSNFLFRDLRLSVRL